MMTPDDVETQVKNLDVRTSRIEQILPSLATKDDLKTLETSIREELKAFATKDDLKAFATKDDLKAFATKDDLKAFATKDDLKAFATKDELREGLEDVRRHTTILIEAVRDDVRIVAEAVATLLDRGNSGAR